MENAVRINKIKSGGIAITVLFDLNLLRSYKSDKWVIVDENEGVRNVFRKFNANRSKISSYKNHRHHQLRQFVNAKEKTQTMAIED